MLEYKGYKIAGESIPMYMAGCESLGTVYRKGRAGSIIEVARIEGKIFKTIKEAESHGLEMARRMMDQSVRRDQQTTRIRRSPHARSPWRKKIVKIGA